MALTIISICLLVAIQVYAVTFSPNTSAAFYKDNNKANEVFFLMQLQNDSLMADGREVQEEDVGNGCLKITVANKNSKDVVVVQKTYYVQTED